MLMESSKSSEIDPFERLYTAKWNVPRAAEALGLSNEDCKEAFRRFMADKLQNES